VQVLSVRRVWKEIIAIVLVLSTVFIIFPKSAFASERASPEVIILFDISTSMRDNDTEFLAPDALKELVNNLPSYWNIGLVTYNIDLVHVIEPVVGNRAEILQALDDVQYISFTNAAAGLEKARELFSEHAQSQTILFVTDGEKAAMPSYEETAQANQLADVELNKVIESDITVHSIIMGHEFYRSDSDVIDLAEATGGRLFANTLSTGLRDVVYQLLFDTLQVPYSTVGVAQMADGTGNFVIRLPMIEVDLVRIFITGESAIANVVVSGAGSEVEISTGQRFATIEIVQPTEQEIQIAFTGTGTTNAYMMLEWDLHLMAEHSYIGEPIQLWLADDAGNNVFLNSFFEGESFDLLVNEEEIQGRVKQGYLQLDTVTKEAGNYIIQFRLDTLGINTMAGSNAIMIHLESMSPVILHEPQEIEPEPIQEVSQEINMTVLVATMISLVLVFLLFVFLSKRKKKTETARTITSRGRPAGFESKYAFSGKLNLYVTHTPEDVDIPPQTFDLFRLGAKQKISLGDILQKCSIARGFSGVENIYFAGSKQHALQVINGSDCTIMVGRDLLIKNQSRMINYGEKIHVTCADEVSELELHYRNVKPSEKRVLVAPLIGYNE